MANLKEILQPEESVIDQFPRMEYQGREYNCAITTLRTLLYKEEEQGFNEIRHKSISFIALEKEWYIDLIIFIPISFCLAFIFLFVSLITYFPLSFTPANVEFLRAFLYPGIVFIGSGIGALYFYLTRIKFSVILSVEKEDFQLFSKPEVVLRCIRSIKQVQAGKIPLVSEAGFEFPSYLIVISKILIGVSTVFFIIVEWFGANPSIRALFYIPFLVLLIGLLVSWMGYKENRVKVLRFKLGLLLLFIGMNFMWFLFYINVFPLPGLIVLILGAGLFIEC